MWMIKITIKANQIDMDVLFISEVDKEQKLCLSLKSGFFHYYIGCDFYPHRQTWYQKFIGTYLNLVETRLKQRENDSRGAIPLKGNHIPSSLVRVIYLCCLLLFFFTFYHKNVCFELFSIMMANYLVNCYSLDPYY